MTTETTPLAPVQTANITSPVVQGDTPQPVVISPVVEPTIVVDPAANPEVPAITDPAPNPNATPEWAQKRINELTAKRYEAERLQQAAETKAAAAETKAADLLAQLAKPVDPNAAKPVTPPAITEEEMEKRVTQKAALIAQQNEFNRACNAVVEIGKKEFAATWDESIKNLSLVGALGKDVSPEFLQTAIELRNPAAVLNYLGKNLEQAEKIVKSGGTRMALELARIEAQLSAPPAAPAAQPVSQAPAPVIPVGGATAKPGAPSLDDPNISGEDWFALRAKQVEERKGRYKRA